MVVLKKENAMAKAANPTSKALHVTFKDDGRTPSFEFVGVWRGVDVSTVSSNFRRAYLIHQRDSRRAVGSENINKSAKETV
jgi:hypothetical protein